MKSLVLLYLASCLTVLTVALPADDEVNRMCIFGDIAVRHGHFTMDTCNRCKCFNGKEVCEDKPCNKRGAACVIDGKKYASGQPTPDECGRCRCRHGNPVCDKSACVKESD
ncbi:kielin/chordin-like protein isoform X2 [Physella acuta]|uniref:kielin/chordin-like protein isoform X2 n=1 Tax=Physella acuta TaxID=109671 RepID=UPI0027DC82A4|nr:kielin/chordin-like protein isoform X2 [Physella acuta]